jgi:uncharacterized protein YhaN
MKILELQLLAFGPFTGTSLDFAKEIKGLHIVYGPNEAGKSTTLRALRALLFGIETRSTDDHVHSYNDMRIGAKLQFAGGEMLQVVRRKGNKNTLRDASDTNPIESDELAKALGHIDEAAFKMRFGLSHQTLVEGGKSIAEGDGDVGETLFAASAGVAHLSSLQAKLRAEAEALYKPQARVLPINAALGKYNEAARSLRGIQLSADEWLRRERALADAKAEFAAIDKELADIDAERSRLARFKASVPLAARRAAKSKELAEIGSVPALPRDFAERRELTSKRLQSAADARSRAEQELRRIDARLAELGASPAILAHAAAVDAVCRDLSIHTTAAADRAKLAPQMEQVERQINAQLEKIGRKSGDNDELRLVVRTTDRARIEELSGRHREISARLENARHRRRQLVRKNAEAQDELARQPALGDDDTVKRLLKRLQPLVHAEPQHAAESKRIAADAEQLTIHAAQLAFWGRDLDALERLAVPANELVQRYETQLSSERGKVDKARQQRDALATELAELRDELAALQASGQTPSESELNESRQVRDAAWRAIRDAIAAGHLTEVQESAVAFDPLVAAADSIADRMRSDADAVAKRSTLEAQIAKKSDSLARAEELLSLAQNVFATTQSQWVALWQPLGIMPGAPREMLAWVGERQKLCERSAALRERRADHAARESEIEKARSEAAATLEALGRRASGVSLVHHAEALEAIRDDLETRRARRQALESTCAECSRELAAVDDEASRGESELRDWNTAWAAAVEPLGQAGDLTPATAQALLADLAELRGLVEKRTDFAGRITAMERNLQEFAAQVAEVAANACPDLAERAAAASNIRAIEAVVGELDARLVAAREADGERRKLAADRARFERELKTHREGVEAGEVAMDMLCREAAADSASDLPAIEERWRRTVDLRQQLAEVDEALLAQAGGAPLETFLSDLAGIEPDSIAGQLARLDARHGELFQESEALRKQIWELDRDAKDNCGRGDAAVANADLQEQKAQLEIDVARYTRLKLAATVLRMAIDKYRKENEAPVLTRASDIFAGLTCGEFSGLRVDYDGEHPILVAVRKSTGKSVRVHGMSDGTCDQLYLALRLASVEQYLDAPHPPIPFIVDDVLQRFDDRRAAAALAALAELGKKTQVIFFTHHRHVLELAAQHLLPQQFSTHMLGVEDTSTAIATPVSTAKAATKKKKREPERPALF